MDVQVSKYFLKLFAAEWLGHHVSGIVGALDDVKSETLVGKFLLYPKIPGVDVADSSDASSRRDGSGGG